MVDEAQKTNPEPAAAATTAVAAGAAPTAPIASPEPAAAAAVAAAGPAQTDTVATVAETPSLLETAPPKLEAPKPAETVKPADAKPAEAPKVDAAKPAAQAKPAEAVKATDAARPAGEQAKAAEPAKPQPVEYKYALPEGLRMDDAQKTEFHGALDAFRADPGQGVQKLVDLYNKSMQEFAKAHDQEATANQHRAFNNTRKDWAKKVMADPILGGAGHQTAMGAVARAREALVPAAMLAPRTWSEADLKSAGLPEAKAKELAGSPRISEFEEFLRVTGAGDHPVMLHIMHNAARYLDEPQAVDIPTDLKPPPDIGRDPTRRRGAQILYDNPRSQGNGRGQ